MELRKYFKILWRRKLIIITTTIVTIAVVGIGTRYITPMYQASATLRIAVSASGSINYSDFIYADRLMNTYVEIATSRPVVKELVKRLGLTKTPILKVEIVPNTELIRITVEDTNPKLAATAANSLALPERSARQLAEPMHGNQPESRWTVNAALRNAAIANYQRN